MSENFSFLREIRRVGIVGLSPDPSKDSHKVAKYLQDNGYEIYPIYPKESEILGRKVYRNLLEISDIIDMVVMFRKGEFAKSLVHDVIQKDVKNFWLQLGITNEIAKISPSNTA